MKIYTVAEVSVMLKVQERTVREYLKKGILHGKKVGKFWRISEESLSEFLNK